MNSQDFINYTKHIKITENEFKQVAKLILLAYPPKANEKPFLYEREAGELWFDMLKDIEYLPIQLGIKKYIRENKFVPTISDIVSYSENIRKELQEADRIVEYYLMEIEQSAFNIYVAGEQYKHFLDAILSDDPQEIIKNVKSFALFAKTQEGFFDSVEGLIDKWKSS